MSKTLLVLSLAAALPAQAPVQPDPTAARVVVLPFENTSGVTQRVTREVVPDTTGRQRVDALAELCRASVEEVAVNAGVAVVERARVSSCLEEMEFGGSGTVDATRIANVGRLLGATVIVTGAITSIRERTTENKAYGLNIRKRVIAADVQVSVLSVETGLKLFTKTVTGTTSVDANRFRKEDATNLQHDALRDALAQVGRDPSFVTACRGRTRGEGEVSLSIVSEPAGADVLVDGDLHGQTPVTITGKAGAVLELVVRRAGYEPWQARTKLDPSKPPTLRVELERKQVREMPGTSR